MHHVSPFAPVGSLKLLPAVSTGTNDAFRVTYEFPFVSQKSKMDASIVVITIVSPYLHIEAHNLMVCT